MKRRGPLRVEPVEAPYLIRTVLRAEAGSYAAVVNLIVKPLLGMMRRVHRAYRLARCIVTVLAQHGEKHDFFHTHGIMITFHPQPSHFTTFDHPVCSYHTKVVFGVTGCRTGSTPDAFIQVHNHSPAIGIMIMGRIEIPFGIVAFRQGQGERKIMHGQTVLFMRFSMFQRIP